MFAQGREEGLVSLLGNLEQTVFGELAQEKLPDLLELKYFSVGDAVAELGSVSEIRDVFIGFQKHLYLKSEVYRTP